MLVMGVMRLVLSVVVIMVSVVVIMVSVVVIMVSMAVRMAATFVCGATACCFSSALRIDRNLRQLPLGSTQGCLQILNPFTIGTILQLLCKLATKVKQTFTSFADRAFLQGSFPRTILDLCKLLTDFREQSLLLCSCRSCTFVRLAIEFSESCCLACLRLLEFSKCFPTLLLFRSHLLVRIRCLPFAGLDGRSQTHVFWLCWLTILLDSG